MGLQAAARADAEQLLHAELDQLLEHDRRAGAAHAGALHGDRLALPGARVAEQAALGVQLPGRRRSTSRRCTSPGAGRRGGGRLRVVARLGSEVDRHARDPIGQDQSRWRTSWSRPASRSSPTAPAIRWSASSSRTWRGADRPVRRRGRRGRPARGAVPHRRERRAVGRGCAAFADAAARSKARMLIGEQRAVSELWEAARAACPRAARGPAGAAGLRDRRAAAAGEAGPARGDGRRPRAARCPRAPRRTSRSSASTRSRATRTASAGARAPRSRRAARGSGRRAASILFKAEASAWTPQAVQLQQVWTDPEARGRGYATRGLARPDPAAARARARACACSSAPRTRWRSGSTSASACGTCSTTAACCCEGAHPRSSRRERVQPEAARERRSRGGVPADAGRTGAGSRAGRPAARARPGSGHGVRACARDR